MAQPRDEPKDMVSQTTRDEKTKSTMKPTQQQIEAMRAERLEYHNVNAELEAEIERLRAELEAAENRQVRWAVELIAEARAAEREACAKVAEECVFGDYKVQVETAHYIAAAIRGRKDG